MKTYCKTIAAMVVILISIGRVYGITEISDISQLRNYAGSVDGEQVSLLGYYSTTPGIGGGIFYRKTDTGGLTDNSGTIIKGAGNVFWLREERGYICVEDFGAISSSENDDSYASVNKTAFQNAVNYVSNCGGGSVTASGGVYFIAAWTSIGASNVTLCGN